MPKAIALQAERSLQYFDGIVCVIIISFSRMEHHPLAIFGQSFIIAISS